MIPDLPGYGWSDAPRSDAEHAPYTKRAMANAMVEVMEALGHVRFRLAGHDRGGRVAYRLALDHPGRLDKLATLDIVPTWAMWHRMDARLANRAWHWMFLALPAPFPETLIGKDPLYFFDTRGGAGHQDQEPRRRSTRARSRTTTPSSTTPSRIHATCEDYRAGRTTDLAHDEADSRRGQEDRLPDAGDLGQRRRHPGGDRRIRSRPGANGRPTCAALRSTAGTISRRKRRRRPPRRCSSSSPVTRKRPMSEAVARVV